MAEKRKIQMNEGKQQISGRDLGFLLAAFLLGGQHIFSPLEKTLSHNNWLVHLGAGIFGFFLLLAYLAIMKSFPNQSFVQILTSVFGKIVGRILAAIYFTQFIFFTSFSLLLLVSFWSVIDMRYTPQIIIMGIVLLLAGFTIKLGIEVISRTCTIIVCILICIAVIDTIFLFPDMEISYLLPLQEVNMGALLDSMKRSVLLTYFNLLMLLGITPYINADTDWKKPIKKSMFWMILYLVFIEIRGSLVLGPSMYLYDFPNSQVLKVINIIEVLPQVELIGIMALMAVGILRIVYMFFISLGVINDTVSMHDPKVLILPLAMLILVVCFCFLGYEGNLDGQVNFYLLWIGIPLYLVIPMYMLIIGRWRQIREKKQAKVEFAEK